jgi:hypothetical protein
MSCLAATAEWREKLTYPLAMEFAPQLKVSVADGNIYRGSHGHGSPVV